MKNLILVGPPGAGKGTLAERLIDEKGFMHISTGQILREALANKTQIGLEAKAYMDKGELVPDEVVTGIVMEKLSEDEVRTKGFMLDGFPRTLNQAELLDEGLKKYGIEIEVVIYLEADQDTIIKRLSGRRACRECGRNFNIYTMKPQKEGVCDHCHGELFQRDDDKEETVRNRLKVYSDSTAPLVDFYKEKGSLKTFNGNNDLNVIYSEIKNVL
ncbi:MAG: adenylate kinase [Candidatus Aureabacteria bacterium]|nr:adenylate kinase [Candidatus Auribacterota bacterium]